MPDEQFDLFDVQLIALGQGRFRSLVTASPAGTGSTDFDAPFSASELADELPRLLNNGGDTSRDIAPEAGAEPADEALSQRFGQRLFDAAFADRVGELLHESRGRVEERGVGLRIRLSIDADSELIAVPWEYLFDNHAHWRGFIATDSMSPLVRQINIGATPPPLVEQPPLRILVVTAAPPPYRELNADEEWQHIQRNLRELYLDGVLQLTRLDRASMEKLLAQIQRNQPHVLHFIGHGDFDPQGRGSIVMFDDQTDQAAFATADDVYGLAQESRALRLVVLNACNGARINPRNPFGSVAYELVRRGVPAVLAMQAPVTDIAAAALASTFYAGISLNQPIDVALANARKRIRGALKNDPEWGTPVLVTNAPDGRLYDFTQVGDADKRTHRIATLSSEAAEAESDEDLPLAENRLNELLLVDASHEGARSALARVRTLQRADRLLAEGIRHLEAGELIDASAAFNEVADLHGNHRGVFDLQDMVAERLRQQREAQQRDATPPASAPTASSNTEPARILREIIAGRVAIFVGSDANAIDDPLAVENGAARARPPSASQLAARLAKDTDYPWSDGDSLMRVAQFMQVSSGYQTLFDDVRRLLGDSQQANALHRLLVRLPELRRRAGTRAPLIIVSANYDDVLEQTFAKSGEAFDLVACQIENGRLGKYMVHTPHGRPPQPIEVANEYMNLPLDSSTGTIIVKAYSGVDGGYAITEDHHLEYSVRITPGNMAQFLPVALLQRLLQQNFLFLGCNLRDWPLRSFLNAMLPRGSDPGRFPWVVATDADQPTELFWRGWEVNRASASLADFVEAMTREIVSTAGVANGGAA